MSNRHQLHELEWFGVTKAATASSNGDITYPFILMKQKQIGSWHLDSEINKIITCSWLKRLTLCSNSFDSLQSQGIFCCSWEIAPFMNFRGVVELSRGIWSASTQNPPKDPVHTKGKIFSLGQINYFPWTNVDKAYWVMDNKKKVYY